MYRLNVGIIVLYKKRLWLGKRYKNDKYWQFPQGGIDYGEIPLQAAKRELYEETGIYDVEWIKESNWYLYKIPFKIRKKYIGQRQKWFLAETKSEPEVKLCLKEFVEWRWHTKQWAIDHVIKWKQSVYKYVLQDFFD